MPKVIKAVLESGDDVARFQPQAQRQLFDELLGMAAIMAVTGVDVGLPLLVMPNRRAVLAPKNAVLPTWKRFARIPFALPVMQHRPLREGIAQAFGQILGAFALMGAVGVDVPLRAFHIVNRDKSRLAAHGHPHIAVLQLLVHPLP